LNSITVMLDGREVSGRPGTTILELAGEVGIRIPSLCYDPHLSALGACRVCLVEDEASGRLLASCVTPISPGMVINTASARVLENRKNVVELLLASHPDSCIVCDKGNRCELRTIATNLGVGLIDLEKIPSYNPLEELNPFIQRDLSKCIRCGRCIRADQEIAVVGAIDYTDRGFESRPAALHDAPLENTDCNFCGICVSVCPTGALFERHRSSTLSAQHATRTTCTLCGTGCAILLEHTGTRIVSVASADDPDTVNHLSLCVKGHYGMDFIQSKKRLTTPLIRKDGELQPAGWDEALSLIVERFSELKNDHGGNSLGALGASTCTNEENYLLQKLVREGFGSGNIDSSARLRGTALAEGIAQVLGSGTMTAPLAEIRNAEEILVIGADPLIESPIAGQLIKQAVKYHGSRLTLVDELPRGLSGFADTWLRPRPGAKVVLLAGILRQAFSRDCPEPTLASTWFAELDKRLEPFTLEKVEEATGVPAKLIAGTAARLSGAGKLALIAGAALAGDDGGPLAGLLLASLALRTGNLGRPGCGLFPIAASLNDQGALDMGATPDADGGLDYREMIEAACAGKLAGLYVVGENPALDCPGTTAVEKALSQLDFLVVQDRFLTETAALADVVLPSTSFAEKSGTWTSIERRIQQIKQAVPPVGDSRPDWKILTELMGRFGVQAQYESSEDVLSEIVKTIPSYAGVTSRHLSLEPVFQPCSDEGKPGESILFAGKPLPEPTGSPPDLPDPEPPDIRQDYPFSLVVNESLFCSRDRAATAHSATLQKASKARVEMNAFDANMLGLCDQGLAGIRSSHGSIQARVTFSPETPRGMLLLTSTSAFAPSGLFALAAKDQECRTPRLHRIAVNVEAVDV
jgi:formate dehydrogenase (NADP+) alpha subunit